MEIINLVMSGDWAVSGTADCEILKKNNKNKITRGNEKSLIIPNNSFLFLVISK